VGESQRSVIIAGVTTRALAASAARAGYSVTAIDAFGDSDLSAIAEVVTMAKPGGERFTPAAAAALARTMRAELTAYTSSFENHPKAVAVLAYGRRLLGNPPAVLERVRDPLALMRALQSRGLPAPVTRTTSPVGSQPRGRWLLKPRRSGGGHGTRIWRRGMAISRRFYLQQRIAGVPGSIVFAANGHRCFVLGLTRQLVGEAEFGATGFRYCGSLLGSAQAPVFEREAELVAAASRIAAAMTEEFGLLGLNGIDFIARDGVPYPIEVNPRYSASMELVERKAGLSLFEVHRRACERHLPRVDVGELRQGGVSAKAVVFARRRVAVGGLGLGVEARHLADVPHPGERIAKGRPICTVFAEGRASKGCYRKLVERAAAVYRATEPGVRGAA
jgi:predicted ATP-grasp superfamily ATP-dependent carboligase